MNPADSPTFDVLALFQVPAADEDEAMAKLEAATDDDLREWWVRVESAEVTE